MTTETSLVTVDAPDEKALSPDVIEAAKRYASAARSENTRRAYESRWRVFVAWCDAQGRRPLPASAATVAGHIAALADEVKSVSTINQTLVAISEAHNIAREIDPTKDSGVDEIWQGIRRTLGTAPKNPAKPVLAPQLLPLVEAVPPGLLGVRDRALILLGFAGAFRRSELVMVDVEDLTKTEKGYKLKIGGRDEEGNVRTTKVDKTGEGVFIGIPYGSGLTCPVEAIDAWLAASGIKNGAVFRSVDRWENIGERLWPIDVSRAVKNAVQRIGKATKGYSGHSLRAGLATSAIAAGKSTYAVKQQGRWASSQTVDRYIRGLDIFTFNASDGLMNSEDE